MTTRDASRESGGSAGQAGSGGRHVSVLSAVAEAVGTSLDLATSLERALETAMQLIGLEAGIIRLWDEERGALVAWAARGLPPGFLERIACLRPERGRAGLVFRTGQPIFIEDGARPPRTSRRSRDVQTYACVPIRSADRILGTLSIGSRTRRQFAPGDPELLSALGTILGLAVLNGLLVRRLRRRADEVEGLVLASQALASSLEPDAVLSAIVRCASEVADVPYCTLMRLDEQGEHVEFRAKVGMPEPGDQAEHLWLHQGLSRLVATEGRPIAIPDLATDPRAGDPGRVQASGLVSFLGIPIRTKDQLIGVLCLFTTRRREFGREELGLISSFADLSAAALDRARLLRKARRRQEEAEALAEIGRALSSSLHPDQVLQAIVHHARGLLKCDLANVGIYDPVQGVLRSRASVGHRHPESVGLVVRPGQGMSGRVLQTGEPLVTDDYLNDPRFSHDFDDWARAEGTVTELVAPVKKGEEVLGVLWVVNRSPRPFTERDREILMQLAGHAAIALENARLYQQERDHVARLRGLVEVTEAINAKVASLDVLQAVVDGAVASMGADAGILYLYDEIQEQLQAAVVCRIDPALIPEMRFRLGESLTGRAALWRRPVVSADILADLELEPDLELARKDGCRGLVTVPLLREDRLIGALSFIHTQPHVFSAMEVELATLLAGHAAIALENARLYREGAERAERLERSLRELQALQEQLVRTEKLRALGEMASGVAHDFNNLLGIVLARAQLLTSFTDDPEIRSSLAVIEKAALDGAATVRRLQEFTRPRGGEEFEPVLVPELIEDVLNLTQGRWKREAERQGISYRMRRALAPVPPILGNAAELREALTNLVLNALDAMPAGGELSVEVEAVPGRQLLLLPRTPGGPSTPEVEAVEISIRDSGTGMTEEVQRRAFDPFYTTKGTRGTGLGLSVVYGIVTRHGGQVILESAPGRGTTVSLRLPAAFGVAAKTETPAPLAAVAGPAARVLVIDDEADIREVILDILGRAGYRVEVAVDGHQGLAKFDADRFDMVLTDLGMPRLSGWEVADAVKARSPETPVVLITGWGATVSDEQLAAHRIDRLLAKPFRLQDLAASVGEVLARARQATRR